MGNIFNKEEPETKKQVIKPIPKTPIKTEIKPVIKPVVPLRTNIEINIIEPNNSKSLISNIPLTTTIKELKKRVADVKGISEQSFKLKLFDRVLLDHETLSENNITSGATIRILHKPKEIQEGCSICREDVVLNDVELDCFHKFHYDCIKEYIRNTWNPPVCPLCLQPFNESIVSDAPYQSRLLLLKILRNIENDLDRTI